MPAWKSLTSPLMIECSEQSFTKLMRLSRKASVVAFRLLAFSAKSMASPSKCPSILSNCLNRAFSLFVLYTIRKIDIPRIRTAMIKKPPGRGFFVTILPSACNELSRESSLIPSSSSTLVLYNLPAEYTYSCWSFPGQHMQRTVIQSEISPRIRSNNGSITTVIIYSSVFSCSCSGDGNEFRGVKCKNKFCQTPGSKGGGVGPPVSQTIGVHSQASLLTSVAQ
mmetsp:Transcript_33370/g.62315  ORF Transcript_33370/g.62315 Transcript_33370/m.62315 type:complete len:223 (+) Transcript_33370:232-900(+)